ncbi:hypothetical protein JYT87_03685 [Nitrospira defluvii]|nr:hypothetical protein [Nitrospira defluvii]
MNRTMKIKLVIALIVFVFGISTGVLSVSACSSLGAGKHLGVVHMIDAKKGELTLIDAETRKPILFSIAKDQLEKIMPNDRVMITFKSEEGRLFVKKVVVQNPKMSALF